MTKTTGTDAPGGYFRGIGGIVFGHSFRNSSERIGVRLYRGRAEILCQLWGLSCSDIVSTIARLTVLTLISGSVEDLMDGPRTLDNELNVNDTELLKGLIGAQVNLDVTLRHFAERRK